MIVIIDNFLPISICMNEEEALYILTQTPGFTPRKIIQMLNIYESPSACVEKVLQSGISGVKGKEVLEQLHEKKIQVISCFHPSYPKKLKQLIDYPILLYVKGDLSLLNQTCISIIGTRNCTLYGKEMAERISHDLVKQNILIISGLARGIDTAAHIGALTENKTCAVIGSGFNHIYPKENIRLAQQIPLLISEYPPHVPPQKFHFPQRNRIVSALSDGIVMIEAPLKSGAMITVDIGEKLGKPIFTIPGRIDNEQFLGNHSLLKQKKAHLIENYKDILLHLNKTIIDKAPSFQSQVSISEEEQKILSIFPTHEITIEEIEKKLNFSINKISIILVSLVIKRLIKEYPGKIYKRL